MPNTGENTEPEVIVIHIQYNDNNSHSPITNIIQPSSSNLSVKFNNNSSCLLQPSTSSANCMTSTQEIPPTSSLVLTLSLATDLNGKT